LRSKRSLKDLTPQFLKNFGNSAKGPLQLRPFPESFPLQRVFSQGNPKKDEVF
jgi:hypothetical protein